MAHDLGYDGVTMNNHDPAHDYPNQIEPLEPHRVMLEPSLWQYAKDVGRGNASAGLRHIVREAKQATSRGRAE